jgi:hypothetical protein
MMVNLSRFKSKVFDITLEPGIPTHDFLDGNLEVI